MSIDLADYQAKAKEAIKAFWGSREAARQKQMENGKADQGERSGVTAGKNMDGFLALVRDVIRLNGLGHADIYLNRRLPTLPGYFRPTTSCGICWCSTRDGWWRPSNSRARSAPRSAITSTTGPRRRLATRSICGRRFAKVHSGKARGRSSVGSCCWRTATVPGLRFGIILRISRFSRTSTALPMPSGTTFCAGSWCRNSCTLPPPFFYRPVRLRQPAAMLNCRI